MRTQARHVVLVGAGGRMGQFAAGLLRRTPRFTLVAELSREHDLPAALRECGAELGLDLTVAGLGAKHAGLMLAAGIRPVVGTSGVSRAESEDLDRYARERGLGGIVVPNFSLGMACLQRAAEELVRHYPSVEILELHHQDKRDSPSGTALDTAERLERVRGGAPVPIHSIRLPGLYAHQEILLGGPGETLTLRHDMLGPEAFAAGLLAALDFALHARGVAFGLARALTAG